MTDIVLMTMQQMQGKYELDITNYSYALNQNTPITRDELNESDCQL